MRGLLAEMGGHVHAGREPPPHLGLGLVDGGYEFWNRGLGWGGPNYVRGQCVALLSVGSNVLPDALRQALLRVEVKLDTAVTIQREGVTNEAEHAQRLHASRSEVYYTFKDALPEVKKAVKSFGVRDGLDWEQTRAELRRKTQNELKTNAYAVALSAFLTAMHQYLARYIAATSLQWDTV